MEVDPQHDAANTSDEEIPHIQISAAEKAAQDRKRRLLAMKSKIHGVPMSESDYQEEEKPTKRSTTGERIFRNYAPNAGEVVAKAEANKHDFKLVEQEIASHLEDTKHDSLPEQIDITTLQPKKIDWDLKRNIEKKMQKLERRTQRAIAEIIRTRLAEGSGDLATAVSAGTIANQTA